VIEHAWQDLRLATRMRNVLGFSVVTVLTLGLSIGATTASFSQVNAVFLKPLPVSQPHELRSLVWFSKKPAFVGCRT
jgi:hypothetical protein